MKKKMKTLLIECFIQECNIQEEIGYKYELTPKYLTFIRGLVVIKYMACQGITYVLDGCREVFEV